MDLLFPYVLHLVVLCMSFALIFLVFKNIKSSNTKLPPGQTGWPIIGEAWAFVRDTSRGTPEKFINERMSKYSSEVFQTSLFGGKMAVFCGASGNKFLFSGENKYVTTWWPRTIRKIMYFPEDVDNSIKEHTAVLSRFLLDFLKTETLQQYIPIMDSMAKAHLEADWRPHRQVTVLPLSRKYTFALACRLFMSIKDPEHVNRLANHFTLVTNGLISVPVNFPGTSYNRAIKGGKMIREELLAIMKQRKMELKSENKELEAIDLLTRMLLASDEEALNDKKIANKIIGLLVASHDTTTSAIIVVLYYLAEHPNVYQKVLREHMEIAKSKAPGELLNWGDVQKMKYSWCVVCEAMRLSPPAQGGFREAITDFSYADFTIPKGWKVHWSVHSTHKNPKHFPDPEKFDPSRFEGSSPAPYTFVPFGGGPRMCAGKEYARLEILVFLHNVVTQFKWEKIIPDEKVVCTSFPMPSNGLPVHLWPH